MASVLDVPGEEGRVSIIHDDTEGAPFAIQVSIDLAALSVRLTSAKARQIARHILQNIYGEAEDERINFGEQYQGY